MVVRSACIVIILMFSFSSAYYLRFVHLNDTRFPLSGGENSIQKCERAEQNGRKREQGGSVGSLKADRPTPHISGVKWTRTARRLVMLTRTFDPFDTPQALPLRITCFICSKRPFVLESISRGTH